MQNNKGMSLIELVIVLAIMAIVAGMVSLGIGTVLGLEAKECASDINAYLKQAKTSALSKEGQKLTFIKDASDNQYYAQFSVQEWTKDGSGNRVYVEVNKSKEILASDAVSISFGLSDGSTQILGTGNSLGLSFNRSSGAYKDVWIAGSEKTGKKCEWILIEKGLKSYKIEMVPETGKHSMR